MRNRLRSKLTYANVISTMCLFLLLGGGAYAASALPKNSVGSKQLKNNAVTTAKIKKGAVTGDKINVSKLGTVPSATNAANATHATSADSAGHATSADDSTKLGGLAVGQFVQKEARPGEVLTGQISEHFEGNGNEFFLAGGSYRSPLPASTPVPKLVYTTSTTLQCPGFGSAAPGVLCVYGYNSTNIEDVDTSGQFEELNRRFGFSLDVFVNNEAAEAYLIASWAYQVP